MRVVITGGRGFIGARLTALLDQRGTLRGRTIADVVVADRAPSDGRSVDLDVGDAAAVSALLADGADVVFHLASMVSGEAELDFDAAMRTNLDGTRNVLEACRALEPTPVLVFTSTVAVFGGEAMPERVSDGTKQVPETTYGATKAAAELLVNDYARKGFVDGRTARLPTVIVRPGVPNAAASSFASAVVREPLAGSAYELPVRVETRLPVIGARTVADCLVRLAEIDAALLGADRAVTLPSLSVTVAEMLQALERIGGGRRLGSVTVQPDPRIEGIVRTWPVATDCERAAALGLPQDEDIDAILREYVEDYVRLD